MPGASVSAACGLPSPRTDLETDVGASPHAKPSGTKRPAALVTPSPPPKRSKGSHGSPQQETDDSAGDSSPLSALSDEKPTPQALRHAARDKRKALRELKTTGCGLLDGESAVTVPPPATPAPSTTSTTVAATGALEEPEMATPEKSNPQSRPWSIVRMLRGIGHAMLVVLCGLFSKAQFPLVFSINADFQPVVGAIRALPASLSSSWQSIVLPPATPPAASGGGGGERRWWWRWGRPSANQRRLV